VVVCVIGRDEAGNAGAPYSQLFEPSDEDHSGTTDAVEATTLEISGVVRYLERIAMPPDAIVTVRVEDVSLADAPATVVAEQVIEPTHEVPIPFSLTLDPAELDERHQYSMRAQITVDGELWWISDTVVPVSATEPTTGLDIVLVRISPVEPTTPQDW
jgi:putative lipoprotein